MSLGREEGRKTDVAHNCPNAKLSTSGGTLDNSTTAAIIAKPELLQTAEGLIELLHTVRPRS